MSRVCTLLAIALSLAFGVSTTVLADAARLQQQADIALPGPTGRFDYAARDPRTGLLWLNQMGADRLQVGS